jgi:chemotaxis protein methyltransferase CheR
MTFRLCTTDYQQVFDTIQALTGLRVNNGRFDEVAQVVDDVFTSMRLKEVTDLLLTLKTSAFTDPLWQILIQAITVGETYFFRDQAHFDTLRTHVLPQLIVERRKTGNKLLRLWSAGCASGEEPYSLAMLLHELLPDIETWHIMLLGTDINLVFLERARRGMYRPSSFRGETPEVIRKRWFTVTPEGYQLYPLIRDMVIFSPLNLADRGYPSLESGTLNLDLIICRNVTIYFDQETVCDIVSRFYQALNDKGWLVVGHSEPLSPAYREFAVCNFEKAVLYQKIAAPQDKRDMVPVAPTRPERVSTPPRVVVSPPTPPPNPSPNGAQEHQEPSTESVWTLAKEAADREKWDEALAWLAQMEEQHSFRPELHYLRGLVQMAAENADEALWSLRQAVYCEPMFALAHYSLGELYERQGEYRLAVRHWRQALEATAGLEPQHHLPFADDLTVEMLQGLLTYRFNALLDGHEQERL